MHGGRARWLRAALVLLIALLAVPGTCLRSPPRPHDHSRTLTMTPLPVGAKTIGDLRVEGLWQLTSPNWTFGSYSALVPQPDGRLLAISDRGRTLLFAPPGMPPAGPVFDKRGDVHGHPNSIDAESATSDGHWLWIGYEGTNSIVRFGADPHTAQRVAPPEMHDWGGNSGPEAMTRLPDGRFLVLQEGRPYWPKATSPGLLFAGDPVDGARPIAFRYAPPAGYRTTDASALPDGRVLLLQRTVGIGLPYAFHAKIALADPAEIRAGEVWHSRVLATIEDPLPVDNFEGMAAVPQPDGSVTIWVVSDDNNAVFQRTLLYEFAWTPDKRKGAQDRDPRALHGDSQ